MDQTFVAIRDGLWRLRTARLQPDVFGADSHGFTLNKPVFESAVQEFEVEHRIGLPEDYRSFLINLGNGGAGPYYGIFKLGEMDNSHDSQQWEEGDGFVGVLSKPFPHMERWNDVTGEPEETDDEEAYERALEEFDQRYWTADNVNGAIPICHEGCALRDWLVITGREAGHMWHDARADQEGLYPIKIGKKKRVTFLEWYVHWLNEALARLPGRGG